MKKIYFLLLALLTLSAFAQNYQYTIYNTSNSGILSNYIGDIKMDANGMLWISSYSGVSTFNGTSFTNYTVSNSGIASNAITKIEIDGLNRKWMASQNNGIIRYNGTTWTNYTTSNSGLPNNAINDIAVDGLNNLWVATSSGLTKFNGTTWTTYASLTNINSLATDSNNGVWVTNNNMMYKFNGTDFNLIDQGTYKLLHIENNTIYATTGDGFLTYSTAGTFLNMQYPINSCLSGYQYNDVDVDSANKVWVAFEGNGLQNFTNCYSYTTSNSGLPDNYISTIRTGTSGIVWAGTLQLGLVKMTPIASTCNAPSQFWNQNVTSTTASLNWAAAVPAPSSYVIRYNTTNVIGGIQDATASTSLSLSNLTPNTDYHWWIASVCGEQQSSWTYGGSFYTPQATASCNAPTNTIIYNLGSTSCLIGWTAPAPAPSSGYEVYLATSSVAPGVNTTPTYTSITTNVNIPGGLSPLTSYYCWVRSNCGGAKSNWSLVTNFVTNALTGCNTAEHGLFPNATFEPACSGANEVIASNAWAGEYTNVVVNANHQYTFSSSFTTDIITITNDANVILASGATPLSWPSGSTSGIIRYYLHANSLCHSQNTNRTRYIQCVALASCGVPSALAVSNITSNSCRLTWNVPTPVANSYDIYFNTTNTAPVASTAATQSSNGNIVGSLNGLSASTTYYYWVRSNCTATKSAWVSGGSFTTIAALNCNGAIYGLYPETTFTPTCSASSEQIVGNAWAGEYSNVNVTSNHQYTFSSSIATDYITITNASGTSVLASGTSPLVWNSNATSGVVRYHLNTNVNCGFQNTARARFIQCTVASSSCGLPSNLVVSNITSNSSRLSWNPPTLTAPNSYDLYVSTNSTAPIATTTATQISNSSAVGALSGLSASTTYYYWVRSNCNGIKSAWVSGGSFTTIAALNCNGAFYGLYPIEAFTPSCTGNFEQISDNAWAGEYSNVNVLANKQYTFTSSIATDYITITNANGTSVLASGLTPLNWNSASATGVVRYHINTNANCGVQNSARIKSIQCIATSSCGLPSNLVVSNITSNSCRLFWNSPTPAANSYDIYMSTSSTAPSAATNATQTSTPNLVGYLNGLSASTTYFYWVRSNCNGTKSAWVSGGSFTTNANLNCNGAFYGLYPTDTFTPSCTGNFEQISINAWAGEYSNVNIVANKQYTFTSSIATDYITITNANGTSVLASGLTPLNWNSASSTGIIRYHINTNSNCGIQNGPRIRSIKCETVSSCSAPTQFGNEVLSSTTAVIGWIPSTSAPNGGYLYAYNTTPIIGGFNGSTSSTIADLTNLMPNTTYYWWVASNCVTSQSEWAYGGSFTTLSDTASCNAPTQFWSEDVTSTTATLNWIPSTSAPNGGYLYVYNTNPTVGGFDGSSSSTSADLTDLLPNTTYYWWVAADCVTSQSQWALGGSFTTLSGTASCNAPAQFWSEDVTSTTATLNWIPSTSAPNGGYLYVYNTNPTVGGFDGSSSSTSADLTDLLPNTTYYWWVAADCVTGQSEWAPGGSFTTLADATGCWKSVSAGMGHSIGIRTDGTLWAWGGNSFGQLGDGTTIAKSAPVQIGTANDWQSVSAGTLHTMAIKTNGTLWGWGLNGNSQLGDGTTTDKIFPTQVSSATDWQSVCAGDVNTLAIKTNGTLWAWGYNGYAQFGDGTMNNKTTPYQVGTATNWKSIDVGNLHTIAVKTNGTLWAWGTNTDGQVGDGTTAVRFSPVQIGTETDWKSIAAGANHSVALKTNGVLYTWGHNQWGQLGDGANVSKSSPSPVFDQVQNISAGAHHTAGTTTFGNMWSCGGNFFGQLGDGTTTNKNTIQVFNSNNHQMISAGTEHTFSLHTDGSISACGSNGWGKLGNGSTVNSSTLVSIACSPSLDVKEFATTAMKFYPNPVNDMLNISFEKEITKISIYNLLGQEVFTKTSNSNQITVDMSNLASGAYLVKANAGDLVKTEKIIKN